MRKITIRPIPDSISESYWVEMDDMWIGNLHKLRNGTVEACPDGSPCKPFPNLYKALDYIKIETRSH